MFAFAQQHNVQLAPETFEPQLATADALLVACENPAAHRSPGAESWNRRPGFLRCAPPLSSALSGGWWCCCCCAGTRPPRPRPLPAPPTPAPMPRTPLRCGGGGIGALPGGDGVTNSPSPGGVCCAAPASCACVSDRPQAIPEHVVTTRVSRV